MARNVRSCVYWQHIQNINGDIANIRKWNKWIGKYQDKKNSIRLILNFKMRIIKFKKIENMHTV